MKDTPILPANPRNPPPAAKMQDYLATQLETLRMASPSIFTAVGLTLLHHAGEQKSFLTFKCMSSPPGPRGG